MKGKKSKYAYILLVPYLNYVCKFGNIIIIFWILAIFFQNIIKFVMKMSNLLQQWKILHPKIGWLEEGF
jgi:hypothetical protein